ncbi:triose-phosphate isomerase [Candidatus Peregrinibacteria bacterium]|jgi:triosephosphate isomerase (TIM)|nr:triose-phosphate isomerase [Candidatus Peregrinibacteria bacterium]MBT5823531.1 triose-phosphate isomerase [Candidatus Peregrinibacteria bacterium]
MSFKKPIIITNFKAYKESTGANAIELAKMHQLLAQELGVNLAVAGQAMDIAMMASAVSIPVLAQHVDGVGYGAYTGSVPVEIAHAMGVDGSMLNHSEHRISDTQIQCALEDLEEMGMLSLVCAENVEEGHKFALMGADFIAIEPPELIGGDVSVSTAQPELIEEAVKVIGEGKVIVGAGIKTGEDVAVALKLGAVGVLVASGVIRADDQAAAIRDLCSKIPK